MLRNTRPSIQSYQVAAVCGVPCGLTVATTAGFGSARNASISGGTGTGGMPSSLLSGHDLRFGRLLVPNLAHCSEPNDEERADDDPARRDHEVRLDPDRHRD